MVGRGGQKQHLILLELIENSPFFPQRGGLEVELPSVKSFLKPYSGAQLAYAKVSF